MDPEQDLVIVSMHFRGFPQADFYRGMGKVSADEFERIGPQWDNCQGGLTQINQNELRLRATATRSSRNSRRRSSGPQRD